MVVTSKTNTHTLLLCLTIVRHVAVSSLEHQVDAMTPSTDLLDSLAVGHPSCAVPINLHELIAHLQPPHTNTAEYSVT